MAGDARNRAVRMAELARVFREYLVGQTDVELVELDTGAATVALAFERLDLALGQLADLASVYGDESRGMLDPLVMPAAALAGEYLRLLAAAAWVEPDPDLPPDDSLLLALASGVVIDLHGLVRAALAGPGAQLAAAIGGITPQPHPRRGEG